MNDYVKYNGPKYGKDKVAFFSNADIFVQPTLNDCFPLTLLEAMQYKLPIVSTHEGAVPDIVTDGKNGLVCQREDALGTATAIETLLKDEETRTQMGENGYKIFKEKFTLDIFNNNITRILKELLL